VAIEPTPDAGLAEGLPGVTALIRKPVQAVERSLFERLGAGDILFIDSSHVARTGGDVPYLYLDILPRLRPGVLVHVHDIFFPHDYPREWVLDELRFWNEQYLLQAFLAFNSAYEVLFCSSYLGHRYPLAVEAVFSKTRTAPAYYASSFWMRRREEGQDRVTGLRGGRPVHRP
jgi:hypothetical protein